MPRAKLHPDQAARLRANAEARRKAGIVRKSFDMDAETIGYLNRICAAGDFESHRAAAIYAITYTVKNHPIIKKTG